MTREEKLELLNRLLEIEEKNDIGNLTRAERGEFQQWIKAPGKEPVLDKITAKINRMYRVTLKNTPRDDLAVRWNDCLDEVEFQKTLIEYLDTLRPENSKFKGKITCLDCNHEKCMFAGWCDVERGAATILWNAFKFSKMLKEWKEKDGRQV